jgi:serine/threonine protein phosphatase 1
MLLNFLEDETILETWRHYGGIETLQSFNINVSYAVRETEYKVVQREFAARIPPHDLQFIAETRSYVVVGDYFFCHAGVRPGIALDQQRHDDLLWIREEFLTSEADFGKIVVHGHTPVRSPDIRPNRINLDTGAFASEVLTCLVLQGGARRFILT